ncbi:MAG: serine hydrolase, partial [Phycisphaerae bacterium]
MKQKITILLASLFCTTIGCHLVERKSSKKDLSEIDRVIAEETRKGNLTGAVVLVGQRDKILYCKASGWEVEEPYREKMRRNTIFDLASLTKPIATATSIMLLM